MINITNIISGMTEVGGILKLGSELIPYAIPQTLATAVTLGAVNLVGGILVTHKMLELFRKKDSSLEY